MPEIFSFCRLAVGAMIVLAASATFAFACEVSDWRFGGDRGMRVKSGEACDIAFGTGVGASAGVARNVSMKVVVRPQHGRAGSAGTFSVAYVSQPQFMGKDSFQIEIMREINGTIQAKKVTVAVEVHP